MCKVGFIAKVNDHNRKDAWIFMELLGKAMTLGNNDGLGYAAFDDEGNIFGEKWFINDTAFRDLSSIKGINSARMGKIYKFFGDKVSRNKVKAIILHTRLATCGKSIENTHPFVDNEDKPTMAMIHNGIIYNHTSFPKKYSTCDSEVLAHLYTEHKVNLKLSNLTNFTKELQGWYTVLNLAKSEDNKMIIDAYTDTGRLSSYFIKELDTRVYSSSGADILEVAKLLNLTAVEEQKMEADTAMRIDVMTGEQIEHVKLPVNYEAPVSAFPSPWDGWSDVTVEKGNFDDEEFRKRWFGY